MIIIIIYIDYVLIKTRSILFVIYSYIHHNINILNINTKEYLLISFFYTIYIHNTYAFYTYKYYFSLKIRNQKSNILFYYYFTIVPKK